LLLGEVLAIRRGAWKKRWPWGGRVWKFCVCRFFFCFVARARRGACHGLGSRRSACLGLGEVLGSRRGAWVEERCLDLGEMLESRRGAWI
jgi:hypothetical protein